MRPMKQTSDISAVLIEWYGRHFRPLPWRETSDPYLIWLSEVILQQTRVAQVLDYFRRFASRFPDVRSLAAATEDEVLKLWQGLGYYSRARSLHAAARRVAERFDGVFPTGYDDVRSLPGVGDYTASAVCSIAYGQPCAVVDGNVYRVLSRLTDADVPTDTAAGKRYYAERARLLLDESRPGLYNQAVMEFGALQCVPANPDCECCPLRDRCLSLARGTVADRPPKREKKAAVPRYFNYLHVRCAGSTLLAKRTGRDIWRNLYEFPLIETPRAVDFGELQRTARWREWFDEAGDVRVSGMLPMPRHVLSHRVIHACFYRVDLPTWPAGLSSFLKVLSSEISRYPVSRLTELYLERGE